MKLTFRDKAGARAAVWDELERRGVARFPFPPHGRIPNYAGAREAAERLFASDLVAGVRRMKINPDAPQRSVRELALRRGIVVYVPTPRLRGGFKELDPSRIPRSQIAAAASLSRGAKWAVDVALDRLQPIDLIVVGSVAVTRRGFRCGKGEGYADLEYAILRQLGFAAVPVVTTVHPLQIVDSFPRDRHDLPVNAIVTPDEIIRVKHPAPPPSGIDYDSLTDDELEAMPVLKEARLLLASPAEDVMASARQRAAAAKRKRTVANLPKRTRTALGKEGAKAAKRKKS